MKTVAVHTGRPYEIIIGDGVLQQAAQQIQKIAPKSRIAVVTDDKVDALHSEKLTQIFAEAAIPICKFVFPNGEGSKNHSTLIDIYNFLSQNDITRADLLIAFGGGVVGDLCGFAAATYQRGVRYVQIPTTFLAAVDSSVGGKTGCNTDYGKNLVGAFWQPSLVLCDYSLFSTLEPDTFADGVAETIKYGAIRDKALFELLETQPIGPHLEDIIARCVTIKRDIVESDERDTAQRQLLNFGHTLGHAIERYYHYTITHGHAISIGMAWITLAAERAGLCLPGTRERLCALLQKYGLPTECDAHLDILCQIAAGDKKRSGSQITLALVQEIGQSRLHTIEIDALYDFFNCQ